MIHEGEARARGRMTRRRETRDPPWIGAGRGDAPWGHAFVQRGVSFTMRTNVKKCCQPVVVPRGVPNKELQGHGTARHGTVGGGRAWEALRESLARRSWRPDVRECRRGREAMRRAEALVKAHRERGRTKAQVASCAGGRGPKRSSRCLRHDEGGLGCGEMKKGASHGQQATCHEGKRAPWQILEG